MNQAIDRSDNHGGQGDRRIFLVSTFRRSEIAQLLQSQQRFAGTLALEGGFTVSTYQGIPIVPSRFMDKNGATNTSTWNSSTDADNSMYLLDLDNLGFAILKGVDAIHTPVSGEVQGTAGYNRADTVGGYFKTYGLFIMKAFNSHVHISNLTAPQ